MASLQAIADGLAARLQTISGLRAYSLIPDSIAAPAAVVGWPARIEYEQTMQRGKVRWTFPVTLYAARVDAQRAQQFLAPFFDDEGPSSLRTAIEGDTTLGGAADDCILGLADGFQATDFGGVAYLGCKLTVTVWTS